MENRLKINQVGRGLGRGDRIGCIVSIEKIKLSVGPHQPYRSLRP